MKLLVYGINYLPEKTGIGKYTGEMCQWFAAQGHDVSVITAQPYYPEWQLHQGYKNNFRKEVLDGVTVYRHPLHVPQKLSGARRILHEISFILSSSLGWLRMSLLPRFDIVICIAPPFHSGLMGLAYRRIKRSKLIYHVQDLQVDASRDLGIIRNSTLLSFLERTERSILRHVDLVSSISEGMIAKLNEKIPSLQIVSLPNWVDTEFIQPLAKDRSLRYEWGLTDDDFVVLYSGNLGEKQGLEVLLDAAASLLSNSRIRIFICGNGGMKSVLEEQAEARKLTNITFKDLQPASRLPQLLSTADAHLVLQRKAAEDLVMPSKLTGILAAGGFSIVASSEGSSLYHMVDRHKFGVIIPPEDSESLIRAIDDAATRDLSQYRLEARSFAMEFLEKDKILTSFEEQLRALCQ